MATYDFNGVSAAPVYEAPGFNIMRQQVDLPALVATPSLLMDSNGNPLSSFSGFVQNDVLNLFKCPDGWMVTAAGIHVRTAEGATAAAIMGYDATTHLGVADPNGLIETLDLNATSVQIGEVGAAGGPDNVTGVVFDEDGNVNMTFTTDDTYAAAIFDTWVIGLLVY